MIHRKIRLPKVIIQRLRDIRDSYPTPRPIPDLVRAALRQKVGTCLKLAPTPREQSERIDIWVNPEHAELDNKEISARIAHALIGVRTIPEQIKINRYGVDNG